MVYILETGFTETKAKRTIGYKRAIQLYVSISASNESPDKFYIHTCIARNGIPFNSLANGKTVFAASMEEVETMVNVQFGKLLKACPKRYIERLNK